MKRVIVSLVLTTGALTASLPDAFAQAPGAPKRVETPPPAAVPPRDEAKPQPLPPKPVETALPPNGQLPNWNPLPRPPGVREEREQSSIQARVLHFLQHLFGGPMPHELRSPFSNDCGQRPCPYDYRN